MQRFVIVLPHKERGEEDAFTIELIAGKTMLTDGVNRMRLACTLEPRPLKGWGYTFYEVSGSDAVMSTLMAPPEGAPRVKAFVPGPSLKIRYNSRLPIVIYAPKDYELQYRIWKAPSTFNKADKGKARMLTAGDFGLGRRGQAPTTSEEPQLRRNWATRAHSHVAHSRREFA